MTNQASSTPLALDDDALDTVAGAEKSGKVSKRLVWSPHLHAQTGASQADDSEKEYKIVVMGGGR
ncbi:MAG: hypothetical protein AAF674_19625 [Pseudomonadota bacterium]